MNEISPTQAAETIDLLRRARARIADPSRWIQREFAINRRGVPLNSLDHVEFPACERFCAVGALMAESPVGWDPARNLAKRALIVAGGGDPDPYSDAFRTVPMLNDDPATTHADVLSWFDQAIAALAAEIPA